MKLTTYTVAVARENPCGSRRVPFSRIYVVNADCKSHARVLAFAMDGGFGKEGGFDLGYIALAKEWTTILPEAATSEEWTKYFETEVIDDDGWRKPGSPDWHKTPISPFDYAQRWAESSCRQPAGLILEGLLRFEETEETLTAAELDLLSQSQRTPWGDTCALYHKVRRIMDNV